MMRVKDESGKVLEGIFKDSAGTVVIKNDAAYIKYKQEQQRALELNALKQDVVDMKEKINLILSILTKEKHG